MPATLAQIDAALFTALSTLLTDVTTGPTDARPFALVGRYAGRWTAEGVLAQCGALYPACLLRWPGEDAARTVQTQGYGGEDVGRGRWHVLVVLQEPRAIDDAVQGAAGVPGALTLIGQVIGACNRLFVDGLWQGRAVRYLRAGEYEPLVHLGVAYAYEVVFEALRETEAADPPADDSVPLVGIDGDVNLLPDSGDAFSPNPFGEFDADTDP